MYGADGFAIRKGNKIVAEYRGGMYIIALSIYWKKVNLRKEAERSYQEEINRYKTNRDKFVTFKSLEDYAEKCTGDVIFYLTPKRIYCLNKDGTKEDVQNRILKNNPEYELKEW